MWCMTKENQRLMIWMSKLYKTDSWTNTKVENCENWLLNVCSLVQLIKIRKLLIKLSVNYYDNHLLSLIQKGLH